VRVREAVFQLPCLAEAVGIVDAIAASRRVPTLVVKTQ